MGLNSAIVVYVDSNPVDVLRAYPVLDKPATRALAERLFPDARVEEIGDELLADALNPPEDVAYIGCFSGLDLVCSWRVMPDRPSQLDQAVLRATERRDLYLHAVHGDADWCAYGMWQDGELVRAFSVCPDPGVMEDVGEHLRFEKPYWKGEQTHLELGATALRALIGIVLKNENLDDVDAELIPVVGYRVSALSAAADNVSAGDLSAGTVSAGGAP